jgi:hypothetical protein
MVLSRESALALVEHLRVDLPSPEITWWIEPVESFGRFG